MLGVHLLRLNYKPHITVGRGSTNDIRMNDISVSRSHAQFKLTNNGLFVEDRGSKFGSLVMVQKKFPILKETNDLYLQVGRSVLHCHVKANWKYVMRVSAYKEEPAVVGTINRNFYKKNNPVSSNQKYHHKKRYESQEKTLPSAHLRCPSRRALLQRNISEFSFFSIFIDFVER